MHPLWFIEITVGNNLLTSFGDQRTQEVWSSGNWFRERHRLIAIPASNDIREMDTEMVKFPRNIERIKRNSSGKWVYEGLSGLHINAYLTITIRIIHTISAKILLKFVRQRYFYWQWTVRKEISEIMAPANGITSRAYIKLRWSGWKAELKVN